MNREERKAFVKKHRTAVFGTHRKSDGPAQSIVYYVADGDDLLVSTMGARAKAKAVERLGKVSLCVLDARPRNRAAASARACPNPKEIP